LKEFPNEAIQAKELNQLGYIFMSHQRAKEAVCVFKFMTLLFPGDANAFDSLAEALIKSGNIKEGLVAYKESLKLNPSNGSAKLKIEQYRDKN